ncbi:CG8297 [Drosophila busckii]|uniref:CG8297 n=1 Tax=Drosophila busckii TaxID=30019 RepID=A0A0M3QV47_DROBS|nr:uncharacterized protein LOC108597151 [Drosophila busckii]ALC41753.1 CG8297 [Drosophila busckii]
MRVIGNFISVLALFATNSTAFLSPLDFFGFIPKNNTEPALNLRGQCVYCFESYVLLADKQCALGDEYMVQLEQSTAPRKPPIMVKCLQPTEEELKEKDTPQLLVMASNQDIVNLLKPIGNATKRHEPGSCVLVHFCSPTSLECANVASLVNVLPHMFPTMPVAYIDAYKFSRFNAEFGIVSLPTLMVFHQGRPMIQYDPVSTEMVSIRRFMRRHTNVQVVEVKNIDPELYKKALEGPLSSQQVWQRDYYLGLSWGFILICLANYMRRTRFWKQLVEMVQRNWRESEETQIDVVN